MNFARPFWMILFQFSDLWCPGIVCVKKNHALLVPTFFNSVGFFAVFAA